VTASGNIKYLFYRDRILKQPPKRLPASHRSTNNSSYSGNTEFFLQQSSSQEHPITQGDRCVFRYQLSCRSCDNLGISSRASTKMIKADDSDLIRIQKVFVAGFWIDSRTDTVCPPTVALPSGIWHRHPGTSRAS